MLFYEVELNFEVRDICPPIRWHLTYVLLWYRKLLSPKSSHVAWTAHSSVVAVTGLREGNPRQLRSTLVESAQWQQTQPHDVVHVGAGPFEK